MMINVVRATFIGFGLCIVATAAAQPQERGYIADARTGCRIWFQNPEPKTVVHWSGPCVDGFAEGPGTLVYVIDGKEYQRVTVPRSRGKANGAGTAVYPDGMRMEGAWKDSVRHGPFVVTLTNGLRVDTEYRDGTWSQRGTMNLADGTRYEGGLAVDLKPDGEGNARLPDGRIVAGTWKKGCFQGTPQTAIRATAAECGSR